MFVLAYLFELIETHILSYLVFCQQHISIIALGIVLYIALLIVSYIFSKLDKAFRKASKDDGAKIRRMKYEYKYTVEVKVTEQ